MITRKVLRVLVSDEYNDNDFKRICHLLHEIWQIHPYSINGIMREYSEEFIEDFLLAYGIKCHNESQEYWCYTNGRIFRKVIPEDGEMTEMNPPEGELEYDTLPF